jgi:hypothetical protein
MEEEAELEWERKLTENIIKLCKHGGADATAIVVYGAAVLPSHGFVLISGDESHGLTEIYDSANGSFKEGPTMKVSKSFHASVALLNGGVAMFGGFRTDIYDTDNEWEFIGLSSCEVFNVESNSFSEVGNMLEIRHGFAAVLLLTGVVLIIGGADGSMYLSSCEFYNPENNTFTASKANLSCARVGHTVSLLPDGRVLVCGGNNNNQLFNTTEIYDPSTDSFSAGPLMYQRRNGHTATALPNGKTIIIGGENCTFSPSTELYDPETNSFTAGPEIAFSRRYHFSALLPDGTVLIGGGYFTQNGKTTEIYDPTTNSFTDGPPLLKIRNYVTASSF